MNQTERRTGALASLTASMLIFGTIGLFRRWIPGRAAGGQKPPGRAVAGGPKSSGRAATSGPKLPRRAAPGGPKPTGTAAPGGPNPPGRSAGGKLFCCRSRGRCWV